MSSPGDFHTQELALCILRSPTTGGIKLRVLDCTQQDLPDIRKIKDYNDMQDYLAYGLLHLQEALLNVHPYSILLAVIISSLTNYSM